MGRILALPLPGDSTQALADLVYAVESAITLDLTTEAAVLPVFRELLSLRKEREGGGTPLAAVQEKLRSLVRVEDDLKAT